MQTIQIKHRFTNAVLFEAEVSDDDPAPIKSAAVKAALDGANLDGANLGGANLGGAYLGGANLDGANLGGAYLDGAYLGGANLDGANLDGANLDGANLGGANLGGANLGGANLDGANLDGAYLDGAYLGGANLDGANLDGAYLGGANLDGANLDGAKNLPAGFEAKDPTEPYKRPTSTAEFWALRTAHAKRYREAHPEVPVVENLDAKILALIERGEGQLEMSGWHTCGTTHCLGGWAVTLAGVAGSDLEHEHSVETAARMIYRASTGFVPHFFADNDVAMRDLRERAAMQIAMSAPAAAEQPSG